MSVFTVLWRLTIKEIIHTSSKDLITVYTATLRSLSFYKQSRCATNTHSKLIFHKNAN